MIKYNYKNKNVVVTGAGSGLGRCIALEFARAGANVVVVDVNKTKAKTVVEEILSLNVKSFASFIDVSIYQSFDKLVKKVIREFGSIDILINSAGICIMGPIESMSDETIDSIIDINLKGTIFGCKAALPYMQKNKYGKIINMSSIAGKLCGENTSIYSTSKIGIIGFTAAIAREYAKCGININCILPGIIRTNMWEGLLDDMTSGCDNKRNDVFKAYTDTIPQGKPQEDIDIANMTLFLCSDEAKAITGQNIGVDGGHTF